jgi:TnpA family transposase
MIRGIKNVVERLNGVMDFIFFGKLGGISTNDTSEQELSVLCLHVTTGKYGLYQYTSASRSVV